VTRAKEAKTDFDEANVAYQEADKLMARGACQNERSAIFK